MRILHLLSGIRRLRALAIAIVSMVAFAALASGARPAYAQALTVSAGGPYSGTAGTPITFVASAPGSVSPQFTWLFGDGASASGQVASHAYTTSTTYTVTVYVTDASNGHTGSATTTATVSGSTTGSLAVNAGGPYTGTASTPITLVATATGAVSPQYTWMFGDGASGSGQVVTHAYTTATTYTVTLYVTDLSNGHTGTATTTATVSGSSTGTLTVSAGGPYNGTAGTAISVYGNVTGSTSPQYSWGFGDGATGSGQSTTHAYSSAGTFTITLTVTDSYTAATGTATTTATIGSNVYGTSTCGYINCSSYSSLYSSNCGIGVLCGSSSYNGSPYGSNSSYSNYNPYGSSSSPYSGYGPGTSASYPTGVTGAAAGINSTNATPATTTTAAASVRAPVSTGDSTPPPGTPSYMPPLSAATASTAPATTGTGTTASAATTAAAGTANQGTPVTYVSGWNLIAGVQGLAAASTVSGPFAYSALSNTYQAMTAGQTPQGGSGYWVDLSAPSTVFLTTSAAQPMSDNLPAGAYTLIGNPTGVPMTITGADTVEVYNTASGTYTQTRTLAPGQGAWAYSAAGGTVSLSPATAAVAGGGS